MAQQKRNFDMTRDMWQQRAAETNITPSPVAAKKFASPGNPLRPMQSSKTPEPEELLANSSNDFTRDIVSAQRTVVMEESIREFFDQGSEEPLSEDDSSCYKNLTSCETTSKMTETITETIVQMKYPDITDDDSNYDSEGRLDVGEDENDDEDDEDLIRVEQYKKSSHDNSLTSPMESALSFQKNQKMEFVEQSEVSLVESDVSPSPSAMSGKSGSRMESFNSPKKEDLDIITSEPVYTRPSPGIIQHVILTSSSSPVVGEPSSFPVPELNFEENSSESTNRGNSAAVDIEREIADLQTEADFQQGVVAQVRKTVLASTHSASVSMVEPRAEAERTVIVAVRKRKGCLAQIAHLKCRMSNHLKDDVETLSLRDANYNARLTIHGMELSVTKEFVENLKLDKSAEFFVVLVFMLKEQVIATENLRLDEFGEGGLMPVHNMFQFHHVEPDFHIETEAFLIRIPKMDTTDDHKRHTPGFLKKFMAVLPKSGSKNDAPGHSSARSEEIHTATMSLGSTTLTIENYLEEAFALLGGLVVQQHNVNLRMETKLDLEVTCPHSGFLTFHCFMDAGTDWIRRWCQLQSSTLYFWRYPDDVEKRVAPLGSFDLRHCLNSTLHKANSQQCARSFSFILTSNHAIFGRSKETSSTSSSFEYFVAADGKDIMGVWLDKLNAVLKTLHAWNQISKSDSGAP